MNYLCSMKLEDEFSTMLVQSFFKTLQYCDGGKNYIGKNSNDSVIHSVNFLGGVYNLCSLCLILLTSASKVIYSILSYFISIFVGPFAIFTRVWRNLYRFCKFYNIRFSYCGKNIYLLPPGTPDALFFATQMRYLAVRNFTKFE